MVIFKDFLIIFKKIILEEVFPQVVSGLREDMKIELENLRDQYEEQRRVEIEKIRAKYLKKK